MASSRTQLEVDVADTVNFIRSKIGNEWTPEIGIVCGSGLGGLVSGIKVQHTLKYEDIPHFPVSSVQGHGKALVFGLLGGKRVIAMTGRFHFYEGLQPSKVAYGIRTLAALGAKILIVTNAAGGVNAGWEKGDLMLLADHISFPCLTGIHPLVGHNDEAFGPRFPAVTNTYSPSLRALAKAVAAEKGYSSRLREGCYVQVSGPSYESRSEIGLMRKLGGDAVGMSTVFEVVAAAHCGMQVLGFSLLTNKCVAPGDVTTVAPSHSEVLEASNDDSSKTTMQTLVTEVCARVDTASIPETEAAVAYKDTAAILAQGKKQGLAPSSTSSSCCSAAAACPCTGGSGKGGLVAHLPAIAAIAGISAVVAAGVAAAVVSRSARR